MTTTKDGKKPVSFKPSIWDILCLRIELRATKFRRWYVNTTNSVGLYFTRRQAIRLAKRDRLQHELKEVLENTPKLLGFNEYATLKENPVFISIVAQHRAYLMSKISYCAFNEKESLLDYSSELRNLDRLVAALDELSLERQVIDSTPIDQITPLERKEKDDV